MDNLKEKIIYHTLEFLDTGDIKHSQLAKGFLTTFAKQIHITIRATIRSDTKQMLKDFILNEKGYIETIPKLYNSL